MIRSILVSAMVMLTTLGPDAHGAAAKKQPAKKPAQAAKPPAAPTPPEVVYATGPFDRTAPLRPGYPGHSIEALYRDIVMVAPKGEFETTADYEKRRKAVPVGPYAFTVENGFASYDADSQTMTMQLVPLPVHVGLGDTESLPGYIARTVGTSSKQYPATNALGATVMVQSTSRDIYALAPTVGGLSGPTSIQFKIAPEEAQKVKPNLGILMIASAEGEQPPPLAAPFHGQNGYYTVEPTFESPRQTLTGYNVLRVNPIDVWIFDRATGTVLARMSDTAHASETKLSVYGAENDDGYATVDVPGNGTLGLKRNFRSSGGACHVRVGTSAEVVGMAGGTWTTQFIDLDGKARLVVRDGSGAVLFDEHFPASFGSGRSTPWPPAEKAARAMWQSAPRGTVSIEDAGSKNARSALGGFREIWKWGTENCSFPTLEK